MELMDERHTPTLHDLYRAASDRKREYLAREAGRQEHAARFDRPPVREPRYEGRRRQEGGETDAPDA